MVFSTSFGAIQIHWCIQKASPYWPEVISAVEEIRRISRDISVIVCANEHYDWTVMIRKQYGRIGSEILSFETRELVVCKLVPSHFRLFEKNRVIINAKRRRLP